MAPRDRPEFFIGYQKRTPAGLGRWLRAASAGLLLLAAVVAALVAARQQPVEPGSFEYGVRRSYEGTLSARPYPSLAVAAGAPVGGGGASYDLVAPGKAGAQALVAPYDGRRVRLEGFLISRSGQAMIEVAPGSIQPLADGPPSPPAAVEDLGRATFVGEIVDSKCYLGMMKPGRGKTHRDCATRCISGGIPPAFVAESASGKNTGESVRLWLVDEQGQAVNQRVLAMVGEPLSITGNVQRRGDRLLLLADPAHYRRIE